MRRQSTPSHSRVLIKLSGPEMFPLCYHILFWCGREVGRGEWGTVVPFVILGGVASRLVLYMSDMSTSELSHSGWSPGNKEKVGDVLALVERQWRVWSVLILIFNTVFCCEDYKYILWNFSVHSECLSSVLHLLFVSNKMQNTVDFCLGVGHKYLWLLYLYLKLLATLLDGAFWSTRAKGARQARLERSV